jgi:hypothetical protein
MQLQLTAATARRKQKELAIRSHDRKWKLTPAESAP